MYYIYENDCKPDLFSCNVCVNQLACPSAIAGPELTVQLAAEARLNLTVCQTHCNVNLQRGQFDTLELSRSNSATLVHIWHS